ncbi:MAG: polyribonucleotide nucleotidyltransferase, partial [Thermodesulfovibrionales bacterium]|nr:polyribonucleotide nucleotidyltransferase [Thermodesulfovibrionales bacterium]
MTKVEMTFKGQQLIIETGQIARQSDGAVLIKYGDTYVLATVVADENRSDGLDFFPLTIDYQEKTYAAGKIPGGFFKREGKPTEKEILTSRLIDRPIRPLFPKYFYQETQGIISVLSYGDENIADILGIIGMSAAIHISDIPFNGPVSAVRIGRKDGNFILNPSHLEMETLELNLVVAGTTEAVIMVEGGGNEVSEEILMEAISLAHEEIKKINQLQDELKQKIGKEKKTIDPPVEYLELKEEVINFVKDKLKSAIKIPGKQRRQDALDAILKETIENFNNQSLSIKYTGSPDVDLKRHIINIFEDYEKKIVRSMIINEGIRADLRKPDEIRQISCHTGILPRAHGSALFIRGETQSLVVTTLGTQDDEQRVESLEAVSYTH